MARVVTVTANPLLDHVARDPIRVGAVSRTRGFKLAAGGKGLNVARVLARHGHDVLAIGFGGGSTGAAVRACVVADGVAPHFTQTAARTRVGFAAPGPAGQPATALIEEGFAVSRPERDALVASLRALLPAPLVIIGGSVPDPSLRDLYAELLEVCAATATAAWLDSYGPEMDHALRSAHPPALVKPNRGELACSDAWSRCAELHVTDGPRDVEVSAPSGRYVVIPPPVDEVNAVGSGDSYVAALAHARLTGRAFADQLRYAAAAGADNAARLTVADLDPADIERRGRSVRVVT